MKTLHCIRGFKDEAESLVVALLVSQSARRVRFVFDKNGKQ